MKTAWPLIVTSLFVLALMHSIVPQVAADCLIGKYETGDRRFDRMQIGDRIVYYHQRTLGEAIVEKDFVVYQFDGRTEELLDIKFHWREDLPEDLPDLIGREQAEILVVGEIQYSKLFIVSPESDVFPIKPTPLNPCWVVRSVEGDVMDITIIDAASGEILGYGIPPAYTGFSFSGPCYFYPCSWSWDAWYLNAHSCFNSMGYSSEDVEWPTESQVRSHIQSHDTAVFYEIAHGGSYDFASGCAGGQNPEYTRASEIETWIAGYEKMPFTFIGSCDGMCSTGNGTFSYEFRKGSSENTVTVGYCHMGESWCDMCWVYSLSWQQAFFNYIAQGNTVKYAFDRAGADYPTCAQNECMRFAGDESFTLVPIVYREPFEFVVDNLDGHFVVIAGGWGSRNHGDAYDGNTRFNDAGSGEEKAGWRVDNLVPEGDYDVYAWKFDHSLSGAMATNAPFTVYHRTGISPPIAVDQSSPGDEWVYLGNFSFDGSHTQGVMITDDADGYVIADAVRLVHTGATADGTDPEGVDRKPSALPVE